MKISISVLALSLLAFIAQSASAAECMTKDSVPAMMIAITSDNLSLSGNQIDISAIDSGDLVCIRFNPNSRSVESLDFVHLKDPRKSAVIPFQKLVTSGHQTTRTERGITITVSSVSCPGCKADASNATLKIGVLNRFKLVGKSDWSFIRVGVSGLQPGSIPRIDYKGTPFEILTFRTEGGLGGGVKAMRISECVGDAATCMKSNNPKVKHLDSKLL